MTKIACDICGNLTTPNNDGRAPNGWISLTIENGERSPAPRDLCSDACAIQALGGPPKYRATVTEVDTEQRTITLSTRVPEVQLGDWLDITEPFIRENMRKLSDG